MVFSLSFSKTGSHVGLLILDKEVAQLLLGFRSLINFNMDLGYVQGAF